MKNVDIAVGAVISDATMPISLKSAITATLRQIEAEYEKAGEAKEKIYQYVLKVENELEEKMLKDEITIDQYQFSKGVLVGMMKAYVLTFGVDEKYTSMVNEVE